MERLINTLTRYFFYILAFFFFFFPHIKLIAALVFGTVRLGKKKVTDFNIGPREGGS